MEDKIESIEFDVNRIGWILEELIEKLGYRADYGERIIKPIDQDEGKGETE